MKGSRAPLAAIAAAVLIGAGCGRNSTAIDLVEQFESAVKQPASAQFEVVEVELNGEKRRAISAPPPTRLTWKVKVPDDGWLRVAVGTKPESWTQEGNGTYFFVGVSASAGASKTFDELFSQHVNGFANAGDRRWIPVWVDLSAYSGEEVDIIFNTRSGPPNVPDDPRHDSALWGSPEVVVR